MTRRGTRSWAAALAFLAVLSFAAAVAGITWARSSVGTCA